MKEPLSAEALQELIAGYVLYDLTPEESELLEGLMANNPAIATEVARMQQALEVSYEVAELAPPAHLQEAILAASTAPEPSVVTLSKPVPLMRPARRFPAWGAVAAATIVALGISNGVLWRSLQTTRQQLDQAEAVILALQPTDSQVSGNVTVAVNPENLAATLTAENLPPLPSGKVYVLWTVLEPDAPFTTDAKNAILTQTFTVDARGQSSEQLVMPAAYRSTELAAIAITVEDASAPQRHQSKPILIRKL
ncbi:MULTISPECIES: anti-sigma factor [unclassified Leptolyngbya]|uniref:anti-sigma factor n=1 Tax=unclassified Leptolyngbya TaxID=2650499 RepID=UPI0016875BA8|nr:MULTISPECIES: anti-sigma factor [unclassified Leptolyngbya]MBD1913422.1 anti-sigma factor [Leptolyngbya sp. FACHB-8]MBD2155817.1 anti-sigma factor [Leptolyngbya sp. FACHB-16]